MGIPVIPSKQVGTQVPMGDADANQTFVAASLLSCGLAEATQWVAVISPAHLFKFCNSSNRFPLLQRMVPPLHEPLVGLSS